MAAIDVTHYGGGLILSPYRKLCKLLLPPVCHVVPGSKAVTGRRLLAHYWDDIGNNVVYGGGYYRIMEIKMETTI